MDEGGRGGRFAGRFTLKQSLEKEPTQPRWYVYIMNVSRGHLWDRKCFPSHRLPLVFVVRLSHFNILRSAGVCVRFCVPIVAIVAISPNKNRKPRFIWKRISTNGTQRLRCAVDVFYCMYENWTVCTGRINYRKYYEIWIFGSFKCFGKIMEYHKQSGLIRVIIWQQ